MRLVLAALLLWSSAPAFAAGHSEVRLEARLLTMSQAKTAEKYDVEQEAAGTAADSSESAKTSDWNTSTAYPLLGVMSYNNGLALGTSLTGAVNFFRLSTVVGAEVSKTMEFGMVLDMVYSTHKKEEKTEADGASAEEKSHDASRDLGIGPYTRITIPTGGGKIEIFPTLQYLRHQEDSAGTFGDASEEKTGYGLSVEPALVINLNKNLQYFGALDLGYKNYTSGKKVDGTGTTKTTGKLKKDTETSLSVTPLGLRLIL